VIWLLLIFEPIWNSKCLPWIASRNRKMFLLGEKAVRNFCAIFFDYVESRGVGILLYEFGVYARASVDPQLRNR
jgi:hypothetical protein